MDETIDIFVKRIVFGVAFACLPIWHGIHVIAKQTTSLSYKTDVLRLYGVDAFSVGLSFVSFGAAIHFYCFWGFSKSFQRFGRVGTLFSCLLMIVTLLFAICHVSIQVIKS